MCRNLDVFYFVCCCCAIKRASTPSEFLIELEQISHLSRTLEPMLSSFGSPFSVYFPPAARSAFWRENCFSFHFTSLDPRWTAMKKWERQIPTKFRALTRKNAEAWSYHICECVYNNNAPFFTFFILLRFGIIPHFVVAAAMRFFWTPDAIFMCVLIYFASLETIKLFTSFICCEWEMWECCAWEISLLVGGRWMPVASSWVCCKNYAFKWNLE